MSIQLDFGFKRLELVRMSRKSEKIAEMIKGFNPAGGILIIWHTRIFQQRTVL